MISRSNNFCIAITGGTGAGKSTITDELCKILPANKICVISQDSYYKDQSEIPLDQRHKLNYDHPNALDLELMRSHIINLKKNINVDVPMFDYVNCVRRIETIQTIARPIIIVDGILLLHDPTLEELFDLKIYVDADSDTRLIRRLQRDINRGRSFPSLVEQYQTTIKKMHEIFVQPTKWQADIIVPNSNHNLNRNTIELISVYLLQFVK